MMFLLVCILVVKRSEFYENIYRKKNKLKLYNLKNNFDYYYLNNFDRCMSDIIIGYYLKFEVFIKG